MRTLEEDFDRLIYFFHLDSILVDRFNNFIDNITDPPPRSRAF
jgi:hypothetical protein